MWKNYLTLPHCKRLYNTTKTTKENVVRLSKRMSELDLCSRREADFLISQAGKQSSSKVILVRGIPIDPILGQKVSYDETDIIIRNSKGESKMIGSKPNSSFPIDDISWWNHARGYSVVLNKPVGYVSGQPDVSLKQIPAVTFLTEDNFYLDKSHDEDHDHDDRDLLETFQNNYLSFAKRNYRMSYHASKRQTYRHRSKPTLSGYAPAGRLDKDSKGLLLFTRSGVMAKKIIGHPTHIEKEYLVQVRPFFYNSSRQYHVEPPPDLNVLFQRNNVLPGDNHRPLLPVLQAEWIYPIKHPKTKNHPFSMTSSQNAYTLRLVLKEGRKRQIRRMCAELLNLKVISLERIRIGPIHLGNLPLGKWRPLKQWEAKSILEA